MSSNSTYYGPTESESDILTEKAALNGLLAAAGLYGVFFTLYVQTFHLLYSDKAKRKSNLFLIIYINIFFILATLYIISESRVNQFIFIDDRNYPGGPIAFAVQQFSIPLNVMSNVTHFLGTWAADALIIWRGILIYRGSRWRRIMILPVLMYLGSVACSISLMVQISQPNLSLWSSLNFSLPYYVLSLSNNILVPLLIVGRLLFYRFRTASTLGSEHAAHYTSISAMLIESALLISVFSILFLVPYSVNYWIQDIFIQVLDPIQFIAPLLIIYRVAQGRAWTSNTNSIFTRTTTAHRGGITSEFALSPSGADFSNSYPMPKITRTVEFQETKVRGVSDDNLPGSGKFMFTTCHDDDSTH